MALRLHWVPILPSTFFRDKHPRALTLQHKPSSQKPISVSFSSLFSNSNIPSNSISTSRKCRNLLVFQVPCSTQEQSNSSTIIEEPFLVFGSEENETKTRVLAHNVPWTYTVKDIRNLFQKYGTVKDIELPMYNEIRNRGLVFVTMGSAEEAAAVLTNLQSYEVEGRVLRMEYALIQKKKEPLPAYTGEKYTVFVGNLSSNVSPVDLKEFFGTVNVVAAEILVKKGEMNEPIVCAFVSVGSKQEVLAAVSCYNRKVLMGRRIRVAFIKNKRKRRRSKNEITELTELEASTEVNGGGLSENVV